MDAVMDRRIQNLTTELGQTMQFISNAIATLAAAEPDLQPPNRHPANTHRVTKSRSRNNSDLDTTADTSKSSELSLTRADIDNLYKFHKPPEFSASQFRNFVRELAPDDVRDLVDAMRKDNKETSSRDEQDLFNALQEEDVEHPIDVHGIHYTRKQLSDRLWEVFGTSFAKRKEFFRLLKSIPLEDQAGLVLAIPEDGDSKPVQEQKQMCSALLLGQMRLNWALPRDGREDRTKSKASSCEDPASAPDNTTQRFSKPLSSSEDPTPVPDTTSQKCAVRHFSQSHPVYVIGSAKRKSAEHTKYLADVRKYAESKGVSEDVVKECVKEARGQYKLRREQNKPQRSSSQAPGSRPVKPASETIPQDKTASPSPPSFLVEPNRITGSKKRRGTTITEGDGEAEVQSSTNGIMSDNQSRKKRRRDKNENGELAARSPSSPRQSSPKVPEVLENQASISVTARTPQSVRESIPPISNLHEDTENAARKVAAIGKIGKYRRKRQRRRERKKLSMPNLHSPDNLRDLTCDRTLQAEKRLEINDRETSYEYDTISIPTMLSPTRCSSPELGDATFMAYIDSAKKPSPDHIDSAFDAPTELDDGHENLASRVNNKKGWVGPATQSLNRSRASTPSLLGFDQETGEMRVCQETPPRSSAPSVTESIEFDEDSIHERKPFLTGTPISPIEVPGMVESDPNERSYVKGGVSLKIVPVSPLKALVRRVNEILESGSQNLERLDGKGNILIENALASPLKEQLTRVHDILKTGDQKAQVSNVNILQQNHPQPMDLNPPSLESGAETLHSEIQVRCTQEDHSSSEDLASDWADAPEYSVTLEGNEHVPVTSQLGDTISESKWELNAASPAQSQLIQDSYLTTNFSTHQEEGPSTERNVTAQVTPGRLFREASIRASSNGNGSFDGLESLYAPANSQHREIDLSPSSERYPDEYTKESQDHGSVSLEMEPEEINNKTLPLQQDEPENSIGIQDQTSLDETEKSTPKKPRRSTRSTGKESKYFPSLTKETRPPAGAVSCIPFPPLSAPSFGLIQEKVAHNAFWLVVAVMLLNKTRGTVAIPTFQSLIEVYPTPVEMAHANIDELAAMIKPLGLHNNRAKILINLAVTWIKEPPEKGRRHKTPNYPKPGAGAGKNIKPGEVLQDDDTDGRQGAFEIGHLPGCGAYALDSWRIFCRDRLRGLHNREAVDETFQPEWQRVVPKDKELRAYLRWRWLREGFVWDPLTGEKEVASMKIMQQAEYGKIEWTQDSQPNDEEAPIPRYSHVVGSPQLEGAGGASVVGMDQESDCSDTESQESSRKSSRRGVSYAETPGAPIDQYRADVLHDSGLDGRLAGKLPRICVRRRRLIQRKKITDLDAGSEYVESGSDGIYES